jgi:hypothetical protein
VLRVSRQVKENGFRLRFEILVAQKRKGNN